MGMMFGALGVLLAGGFVALLCGRRAWTATLIGSGSAIAGGGLGLIAAAQVLMTGQSLAVARPWSLPGASLSFRLDPLSAWFLLGIFGLGAVAAFYGASYLWSERRHRALGPVWACYNLLMVSMAIVVTAGNAVLFLMAWEVMAIASFFLVVMEDEDPSVQQAGRIYLIATHCGTAFLLAMFMLLGRASGSLDFSAIYAGPAPTAEVAGVLFLLSLVGFGTKAGFMPFHVWLPEAHPAAPSHVSALMSGVMVKTGIYGLIRTLTLLPAPPAWWGWTLIGVGILSSVWGILHALAQDDMKRLLAYSTVENVGIIAMGLGLGVLGMAARLPALAVLGFCGALLHSLNHTLMKGTLFLGAGSLIRATGIRQIDQLGGLARRMPWLAAAMIVGAVAIVGLPPLNGFMSEFLIYLAAFRDHATLSPSWATPAVLVITALSIVGGLAAIVFSKLIGIALLGEPRGDAAASPQNLTMPLVAAPVILSILCGLAAATAPQLVASAGEISGALARVPAAAGAGSTDAASQLLSRIVVCCTIGIGIFGVLVVVRYLLLRNREVTVAGTWDCGYARPTARMQYTGSSLVRPALLVFRELVPVRSRVRGAETLFPEDGTVETQTADIWLHDVYEPSFRRIGGALRQLSWIQQGTTHVYVLYIALTLIVLLVWKLGLN